jgi:hypothetical protein
MTGSPYREKSFLPPRSEEALSQQQPPAERAHTPEDEIPLHVKQARSDVQSRGMCGAIYRIEGEERMCLKDRGHESQAETPEVGQAVLDRMKPGEHWRSKDDGVYRVVILSQRGERVRFERLAPMPGSGREIGCNLRQFLAAYQPDVRPVVPQEQTEPHADELNELLTKLADKHSMAFTHEHVELRIRAKRLLRLAAEQVSSPSETDA